MISIGSTMVRTFSVAMVFVLSDKIVLGLASDEIITAIDTPLPYILYHKDCTAENQISQGTTTHLEAIDGQYGSFCQHDEISMSTATEVSTKHTVYHKLEITACGSQDDNDEEDTNLAYITTYACTNSDCSVCEKAPPTHDTVPIQTKLDIGSFGYVNRTAFNPIPTKEDCVALCFLPNVSEWSTEVSLNTPHSITSNAICSYKRFDANASNVGATQYWRVLRENSCLRVDQDNFESKTEVEEVTYPKPFAISLTFTNPLPYVVYGDGDEDGCRDSNELFHGYTSSIHMLEEGTFCQEDLMDDTLPVYTKIEVLSCPAESMNDDVVIAKSSCTDMSCSDCTIATQSTIYLSLSQVSDWMDTEQCFGFTFVNELDVVGMTRSYQQFHDDAKDFNIDMYLQFINEHSCFRDMPLNEEEPFQEEKGQKQQEYSYEENVEQEDYKYALFSADNISESGSHGGNNLSLARSLVSGIFLVFVLVV